MGTQHTPGPWVVNGDPAKLSEYAICAESRGKGYGSSVAVATQRDGRNPISREEAMANARLIAAAPEMLDVVRSVAATGFHVIPGRDECVCTHCELVREARAAIAKATGSAA